MLSPVFSLFRLVNTKLLVRRHSHAMLSLVLPIFRLVNAKFAVQLDRILQPCYAITSVAYFPAH